MNIKEFSKKLQTLLAPILKAEIQIKENLKLNGVRLTGLIIKNSESNVSPTIYLNPYYDRFLETGDLSEAVAGIIREYQSCKPAESFDMEWFKDFNQVKHKICYRLIHYDSNRALLDSIPHTRYLDLARVYYIQCQVNDAFSGSITVSNAHLDMWKTTVNELDSLAEHNTPALLEPSFKRIEDILFDGEDCELSEAEPDDIPRMYVLTNKQRSNGAAAMHYPGLLGAFSAKTGKDTIILPSSIDEVLLLPLNKGDNIDSLREMVRSVNETQVAPEAKLSDNVYVYRRDTGQLIIA